MNKVLVKVPELGGIRDSKVIEILVQEGQSVDQDQGLITLESDKASMEIPSPHQGVIESVLLKIGDKVNEGDALIEMNVEPTEEQIKEPDVLAEAIQLPQSKKVYRQQSSEGVYAGPFVRRIAFEMQIDLRQVQTKDERGRITVDDLKKHLQGQQTIEHPLDLRLLGQHSKEPLSRVRQLSAKHLAHICSTVPMVTQYHQVDVTDLEEVRKTIRGQKVTLISFVMKALSVLMKRYPVFNSVWYQSDQYIQRQDYHIGFAVDTPDGLVVPVCKDVDQKSIGDIAAEILRLSELARASSLDVSDLQSGCATISSLGGIGGGHFSPIVNSPEAFIVGLSRAVYQPVYEGSELKKRLMMPFSITYDHRLIDGAQGARFVVELSNLLEQLPDTLPSDVVSYTGIGEDNG